MNFKNGNSLLNVSPIELPLPRPPKEEPPKLPQPRKEEPPMLPQPRKEELPMLPQPRKEQLTVEPLVQAPSIPKSPKIGQYTSSMGIVKLHTYLCTIMYT